MQLQRMLTLTSLAVLATVTAASADEVAPLNTTTTATKTQSRIFGGSDADITTSPWVVSLRQTPEGKATCGGTLVAPQYIVTAGHCARGAAYASIGSPFAEGTTAGERIKIVDQWFHPRFQERIRIFDIAVLKLETPSKATPLPLATANGAQDKAGATAVVRGWGTTASSVSSATLQQASVTIMSNAECNQEFANRILDSMVCTRETGNKGTCEGDFGGGLVSGGALVGVASWGGVCGQAPSVYTRVSEVLDFVQGAMGAAGAVTTMQATPMMAPVPAVRR
jgi:secreted trypsin-like serine protease